MNAWTSSIASIYIHIQSYFRCELSLQDVSKWMKLVEKRLDGVGSITIEYSISFQWVQKVKSMLSYIIYLMTNHMILIN